MGTGSHLPIDRLRRAILQSSVLTGAISALPTRMAAIDDEGVAQTAERIQRTSLLPADRTSAPAPRQETRPHEGSLGSPVIDVTEVNVTTTGELTCDLVGALEGPGTFALSAGPFIESAWTPTESGAYQVTVNYEARGQTRQEAESVVEADGAAVTTVVESNLAVLGPENRVLDQQTTNDHRAVSEDHLPELLEGAIAVIAGLVFTPSAGLLGRLIGRRIVSGVAGWLFDEAGQLEKRIANDGQLQVTLNAQADRTYRVRFTANSSFTGKSTGGNASFNANLSSTHAITSLTVAPTGDGTERPENVLTVTKEGVEDGLGAFMLTTTGDVWQGDDSEAVIAGPSAMDFVGPESGTDELRFAGDIENFLLKGQATVLLNGEEVDPGELGSVEELANTLTVESTGTRAGFYGVTVSGTIVPSERGIAEGFVRGSSAIDWVGDRRGTDHYRFSGEIVEFLLKGEANVRVNGQTVDPSSLGV